jgi:hypothetical protein
MYRLLPVVQVYNDLSGVGAFSSISGIFMLIKVDSSVRKERNGRGSGFRIRSNGGKKFVGNPEITAKHTCLQRFKTT